MKKRHTKKYKKEINK